MLDWIRVAGTAYFRNRRSVISCNHRRGPARSERCAGSDSASIQYAAKAHAAARAASSQNMARHPANGSIQPPIWGARIGPRPVISPSSESARAVCSTSKLSRTTARGITPALPTPRAETTLQATRPVAPCASAQPAPPAASRVSPQRSGGRRPK